MTARPDEVVALNCLCGSPVEVDFGGCWEQTYGMFQGGWVECKNDKCHRQIRLEFNADEDLHVHEDTLVAAWNAYVTKEKIIPETALQSANARLAELSDWMHTLAADLNQSAIAEGEIGLRGMCIDGRNRLLDKIKEIRRAAAGEGDGH